LDKHLRAPEEISEEIIENGDVDGGSVSGINE